MKAFGEQWCSFATLDLTLYPEVYSPLYPLDKRLGGPRANLDAMEK
jgi:hypothetical protein